MDATDLSSFIISAAYYAYPLHSEYWTETIDS